MKNIFKSTLRTFAVASLLFVVSQGAHATSEPTVRDIAIGLNDVYVPEGFDANAEAFVVASGIFPNGCYSWSRAEVKHSNAFSHEIRTFASVSQGMCIMVLIPFSKEVRLGKLASGRHNLRFLGGDGTYLEKVINIK